MWNIYANKIIFDGTRMNICPSVRFQKWLEGTLLSLDLRLVAFIVANSHMARWWWHADFYDLLGYGWRRAQRSAWSATGPSHSGASQEHFGHRSSVCKECRNMNRVEDCIVSKSLNIFFLRWVHDLSQMVAWGPTFCFIPAFHCSKDHN